MGTIIVNTFTTWSGYGCKWADSPERRYHLVTPWLLFVTKIGSDLSPSSDRICPRAEIVFVSWLLQYLVTRLPPQLTKQLRPINFSVSREATSWWRNHGAKNCEPELKQSRLSRHLKLCAQKYPPLHGGNAALSVCLCIVYCTLKTADNFILYKRFPLGQGMTQAKVQ